MGRFEDLLTKARSGDEDAFAALEKEFSGSNLREQQEAAIKALSENEPFIRAGKFEALRASTGVDLSLEDLAGVETSDISEDLLREKAEAKMAQVQGFREAQAKQSGFDSVEEFDKAMEALKQKQTTQTQQMQVLGGATASSSGGTPVPEAPVEPYDAALRDYNMAKQTGATQDVAIGEAAHTLMAAQNPVAEDLP